MNIAKILENLNIAAINEMQSKTLEAAKNKNNIILLSPTGSGKTLAFLLPIFFFFFDDVKGVQLFILVFFCEFVLQI